MDNQYKSISELVNDSKEVHPEEDVKEEKLEVITDLTQIAPKPERDTPKKAMGSFLEELDKDLEKSIKDTNELLEKELEQKELDREEAIMYQESEEDLTEFGDEYQPKKIIEIEREDKINFDMFEDEIETFSDSDIEEAGDDNEEEQTEALKKMQNSIKGKIKAINNPVDLSAFTISKKHISANKTIALEDELENTIDWVLLSSGKKITMKPFKGHEIELLNPNNSNGRTRFKMYQDIYRVIYNHIVDVDGEKPTFEAWIKSIKFTDINDLYFAIYIASFGKANTVPYSCIKTNCNNVYMVDTPIEDMVKYKNDEVKERVQELLNGNEVIDGTETIEVKMVSDRYAIGFKVPSIYNVIFEMSILDDKFTDKYADFLSYMVYIDEIYFIDKENQQLVPIDVSIKETNNIVKSIKNKVMQYSKILRTLTPDQFSNFKACIQQITSKNELIDYIIPSATCPNCGTTIKEQIVEPQEMLFTRQQLLLIANSSIN